jgi:flagellar hook-associated protein 1 FlgK
MTMSLASADAEDIVEVRTVSVSGAEQPGVAQLFPTLALDANRVGGAPFFTGSGSLGITLNSDIAADPMRIAVGRSTAGVNDGGIGLSIAELGSSTGGPDAAYRAFLATLGAATQRASRLADNQDVMTAQVDSAKDAAAGVNIDEEMIAMVQYQHAYAASAKFLNVIDEVLATLLSAFGR